MSNQQQPDVTKILEAQERFMEKQEQLAHALAELCRTMTDNSLIANNMMTDLLLDKAMKRAGRFARAEFK